MTLDDARLEIKYLFLTAVSEQVGIKNSNIRFGLKKKEDSACLCDTGFREETGGKWWEEVLCEH